MSRDSKTEPMLLDPKNPAHITPVLKDINDLEERMTEKIVGLEERTSSGLAKVEDRLAKVEDRLAKVEDRILENHKTIVSMMSDHLEIIKIIDKRLRALEDRV